jgi:hypothetical protein
MLHGDQRFTLPRPPFAQSPADNPSHSVCEKKGGKTHCICIQQTPKSNTENKRRGRSPVPSVFSLYSASFYARGRGHGAAPEQQCCAGEDTSASSTCSPATPPPRPRPPPVAEQELRLGRGDAREATPPPLRSPWSSWQWRPLPRRPPSRCAQATSSPSKGRPSPHPSLPTAWGSRPRRGTGGSLGDGVGARLAGDAVRGTSSGAANYSARGRSSGGRLDAQDGGVLSGGRLGSNPMEQRERSSDNGRRRQCLARPAGAE